MMSSPPNVGDWIYDDSADYIQYRVVRLSHGCWDPELTRPFWAWPDSADDTIVVVYENDVGQLGQTTLGQASPAEPPKTLEEQMEPGEPARLEDLSKGDRLQREPQGNAYDDVYACEIAVVERVRIGAKTKPDGAFIRSASLEGFYEPDELSMVWRRLA